MLSVTVGRWWQAGFGNDAGGVAQDHNVNDNGNDDDGGSNDDDSDDDGDHGDFDPDEMLMIK